MTKNRLKKKVVSIAFWQVLVSTMFSFFGVSTESRRQRDFEQGSPLVFIACALVLLLVFLLVVMGVVRWVLAV